MLLYISTNKQQEKWFLTVDKSETPLVEPFFEFLLRQIVAMLRQIVADKRQIVAMLRQIISVVGIKTTNCS